jgi:hypothetical protein
VLRLSRNSWSGNRVLDASHSEVVVEFLVDVNPSRAGESMFGVVIWGDGSNAARFSHVPPYSLRK